MAITQTTNRDGATIYTFASGPVFQIQTYDGAAEPTSSKLFNDTLEILDETLLNKAGIERDAHLSDTGKAAKIEPIVAKGFLAIAKASASLDTQERHYGHREAALFAVPKLDPTASAVAIEDREVRDWWRSLSSEAQNNMLGKIGREPGHDRVMIAMMRSPVPQLDHHMKLISEVWRDARRAEKPDEAFAIDAGRSSIEWARRGIGHAAGIALNATRWDKQKVLRSIVTCPDPEIQTGFSVFGFGSRDVADMRYRLSIEQRRAA